MPWNKYHYKVFTITFISHALLHAVRKNLSNVKKTLSALWAPEHSNSTKKEASYLFESQESVTFFLALLDTAFIILYAMGEFISGALGDRFNLKNLLSLGMCVSSVCALMFGTVSEFMKFYNFYWYFTWWSITGLFQSTGWPTVISIIGNWFQKSSRGLIMGVIGISAPVGNILGSYSASFLLDYGYEYVFMVPSVLTFIFGLIVYWEIASSPQDIGLPKVSEESLSEEYLCSDGNSQKDLKKAVSFYFACKIPGVMQYSLSFACLRMVHYSLFSWLPYYLQETYGWSEKEAVLMSIWFDFGGIIGSILGGIISDSLIVRSPVVGIFLLLTPGCLYGFYSLSTNQYLLIFFMVLSGTTINGASNLISTSIAADLGRKKKFCQGNEALCTVTGIINGTGNTGAALGQLIIPCLIDKRTHKPDWLSIFEIFIVMSSLTFVLLSNIVYRETKVLMGLEPLERKLEDKDM